ncbi:MAG TPA: hypothetical protein VEH10_03695 [Thermoplasmata archaeon]|nr:hypothetical protein [Thermoplasmata archaeon]
MAGVPILDARVMLIASLPPEVTISRSGRLLFKTPDATLARTAFDRLLRTVPELVDASPAPGPRPTR